MNNYFVTIALIFTLVCIAFLLAFILYRLFFKKKAFGVLVSYHDNTTGKQGEVCLYPLDLVLLSCLSEMPLTGYGLAQKLEKEFDCSANVSEIDLAMKKFIELELVNTSESVEGKRTYFITDGGKQFVRKLDEI